MKFYGSTEYYVQETLEDGIVVAARALACTRDENGLWVDKPQGSQGECPEGTVQIAPFTEIGANTVIHIGSWRPTRIGMGARIGALVNIGHNVQIGANVLIAPQVSIAGSCNIGDNVTIWQGAMIAQRLTIGDGAVIGMGAVVTKDVPPGVTVWGNPAKNSLKERFESDEEWPPGC